MKGTINGGYPERGKAGGRSFYFLLLGIIKLYLRPTY
jgi:hypothetical protein